MNFRDYVLYRQPHLVVFEHVPDKAGQACLVVATASELDLSELTMLASQHDVKCTLVERVR